MSNDKIVTGKAEYKVGPDAKLILISEKVNYQNIMHRPAFNHLYIKELGMYPEAAKPGVIAKAASDELLIMLCISGKGTYELESDRFQVLPGQLFLILPHEKHQYQSDANNPWTIYTIKVGGRNISKFCKQPSVQKCRKPMYVKELIEVRRLFDDLMETLEQSQCHNRIMYANLTLQRILALVIYGVQETKTEIRRLSDNVISFMKENIKDKYALAELADRFSYSPSQFSYLFKKETGYAPIEYAIRMKMQQACYLLQNTGLKIYEVGYHIGYKDPYHFSKIFKMMMNLSPEQYRMSIKDSIHPKESLEQK